MIKRTKTISGWIALATGLAVSTVSVAALAVNPSSPKVVEYMPGTLLIQLDGGENYYGVLDANGTECDWNNQTVDTLKAWQSLAQAALLSGKKLLIYSNFCGDRNYISAVDLRQ
jgi:hypothetical protein